jgi:hypothetical protein
LSFEPTLNRLIAALVALRTDDFAGALPVSLNAIADLEWSVAIEHDFRLEGVCRRRWGWGDGRQTINLEVRRYLR